MTLHSQASPKAKPLLLSLKWGLVWRYSKRTGLAALSLSGTLLSVSGIYAQSLPTGQIVEPGSTTTTFTNPTSNTLTVTTRGRSVISWGSFNIGGGNTVDFQNGGAVLNYVRQGAGASQINGALNAINPIILLNNQGISVGGTASISVPSILLSTGSMMPDSISKFLTGVNYGSGLNAPLISIELNDTNGAITVDGSILSTNGGGIGLIAPSISVGPTARLESLGFRNAGTDGVNTTVNGVVAEGSLWLGTTGLPPSPYTQPIPGMPGSPVPTLPTGWGFTQVSGRPSPQNIRLSLRATYDFERVVIGTGGAKRGQFDDLFFSPSFRAANFYLYDGIEAIEEGHRVSTTGGLRRTLKDVQTQQLIDDQLESSILGLNLPAGATLLSADGVSIDDNGQIIGGNLVIDASQSVSQEFQQQFGSGAFTVSILGSGQGTLTGGNGEKASYNPSTGQVSWTRTVQGPPITETVVVPGSQIPQGTGQPPSGLVGLPATTGTYVVKPGGWYHGVGSQTQGAPGCHGCREYDPVTGQVTYWKGHFASSGPGQSPHFVADPQGNSVVYQLGGRYYVTTASSFFQNGQNGQANKPSAPAGSTFRPEVVQTVTRPGATTVVPYSERLPIQGNLKPPIGSAQSSWVRPTQPPIVVKPTVGPGPNGYAPGPSATKAPDVTGYAPVPTPTPGVATVIPQPSFTGYGPVPTQPPIVVKPTVGPGPNGYAPGPSATKAPDVTGYAPVPTPTPGVATVIPQPSFTGYGPVPTQPPIVVKPTVGPGPNGYAPGPSATKAPDVTGYAPVPTPTPGVATVIPQPSFTGYGPVPTQPPIVVKPTVGPGPSGYAPGPSATKAPDVTGYAPVPTPTPGVATVIPQPSFTGYGPVPTQPPIVVKPTVGPGPNGYAPGPSATKAPDVTGYAPVPTPTPGVATVIPQPSFTGYGPVPTQPPIVVKPTVGPGPSGYAPGPSATKAPDVTGYAPVPTPTPGVATVIPQPSFTGYGPVPTQPPIVVKPTVGPGPNGYAPGPSATKAPDVTGYAPVPTPTPGVATVIPQPSFTGYGPVPTQPPIVVKPTVRPGPNGYAPGPSATKAPDVTGYEPVPTQPPVGVKPTVTPTQPPVLKPAIAGPDLVRTSQASLNRPGVALSYQVPPNLIDSQVPGGMASRSRATLPDGRPLPAELEYDPTSQTFTVRDTSKLPLPLDVVLTMPTRTGGQGRFLLTIGQP